MQHATNVVTISQPVIRGAAVEHRLVVGHVVHQLRIVEAGGGALRPVDPVQMELEPVLHQAGVIAAVAGSGLHDDVGDGREVHVRSADVGQTQFPLGTIHVVAASCKFNINNDMSSRESVTFFALCIRMITKEAV